MPIKIKFRYTAEQLVKLDLGPLGKCAKLATELNALLEEAEAKCKRVYGRFSRISKDGICVEWYTHAAVLDEDNEQTALLWGVEKIEGEKSDRCLE